MESLLSDIRYALRGFGRAPTFTAVAVLTLGLGIGANTAIFTVVDAVLLEPLPYAHAASLASANNLFSSRGEFVRMRERTRAFSALAAYNPLDLALSGDGDPVRVIGASVSANLFTTLGVGAQVGRTFLPNDDFTGHDDIVVLSHDLWLERYGGDPRVLGRTMRLDGITRTIVGVMPATFHFPSAKIKLWFPMNLDPGGNPGFFWGAGGWYYVGRLAPGVTATQASADTRAIAHAMRTEFPWPMPSAWGDSAYVVPLQQDVTGPARPMLGLLLGAVGLVLLVACVNVANLVLARAASREREMAIRTAVGGSRGRIARQLLTESITLASLGGVLGLVLAIASLHTLVALLPADTPRLSDVHLNARVLIVTALLVGSTGVAFGLAPVLRLARRPARGGRRPLGEWLVAAQIALAVVLVVGAGLLGKSLLALQRVDPGFVSDQLVTATMELPSTVRDSATHTNAIVSSVLQRIEEIPGVQAAAAASTLPLSGQPSGTVITSEAHPLPDSATHQTVGFDWVTSDYFRTMGIPLREGRGFTDADRVGALHVIIVDQLAARTYWPGEGPIGQRVRYAWMKDNWMTVIGVVGSVRHDSLNTAPRPSFYRPLLQLADWEQSSRLSLAVRSAGDPAILVPELRAAVTAVNANVPLADIVAARDMVSQSVARPRTTTLLLGVFALAALLLGAIGIYGVMSHAVARRTRDIGIRMALGAQAEHVLTSTVRQGLVLVLSGVALGLVGAVAATRVLRAMLFGVSAVDPVLYALVPCLFAVVAIAATWAPARRAARVNPIIAIRSD